MSILSKEPDGLGFYYGYAKPDMRRVDVAMNGHRDWRAYVAGEPLAATYRTKNDAERAAVMWIENNPEPALQD